MVLSSLLWIQPAFAGPPELFSTVVDGRDADSLLVAYDYGGGGMYVSRDAGAKFGLLCSDIIQKNLRDGDIWARRERPDGRTYIGMFSGLLVSDPTQCSWNRVEQFDNRWVTDLVRDPDDANVTYLITSSGSANNGTYVNDGKGDAWTLLGEEKSIFLTRMQVAKTADGVRFYQSAVIPAMTAMEKPRYFIRVSNDRGATWAEHEYPGNDGSLRLMGVDPTNPDRIVVGVQRMASMAPDDLLFSAMRGQPGTFQKIGTVTTLASAAFTPEGSLYYGDNDQGTPGLFKVDELGDAPRMLSNELKVGCLSYDASRKRLYVCRDWQFGTADLESGGFTMLADMRTAEHFIECPDEAGTAKSCAAQFQLNYCGAGHYPEAPLCRKHYGTDPGGAPHGGAGGAGGAPSSPGAAGAGGSAGAAGSPSRAGAGGGSGAGAGGSGAPAKPKPSKRGSCAAVGVVGSSDGTPTRGGVVLVLGLAGLGWAFRRRRSTAAAVGGDRIGPLPQTSREGMTTAMLRRNPANLFTRAVLALGAAWFAAPSLVHAGPIELLTSTEIPAGNPDRIVARWIFGDGGMFISNDRGASFQATCLAAAGVPPRDLQSFKVASDGSICIGTVNSLHCSDAQACGWKEATELQGRWIADFANDPVDEKIMYLATGTAMMDNGLYVREAPSAQWKKLGTHASGWFSRLRITKVGDGKRFYGSAVETLPIEGIDGGPPSSETRYFVRYSDDDAKTWVSHQYDGAIDRASFRLAAVDPTNPDRIVMSLLRTGEGALDDLFYSDKRGEPGSWVKIGSVTTLVDAVFTPDGALYYGDNDQMTPGLFKVAKLGDAPVKLSSEYKVGCLAYDAANDRLYACSDWRLGTVDRETGAYMMMLDLRVADQLHTCEGEAPMRETCGIAFFPPNYCDPTHYPEAPVCLNNFGPHGPRDTAGTGAVPAGGTSAAGAGGGEGPDSGAGGGGGGVTSSAGATAAGHGGGGRKSPERSEDGGGCTVAAPGARSAGGALMVTLGLLGWVLRSRRFAGSRAM